MADEPLSPQDRAKVFSVLHTADPTLADRVAVFLDDRDDPIVRILTSQRNEEATSQRAGMESLQKRMGELAAATADMQHRLTMVVVIVSIVAMALNATLVGVAITVNTKWGSATLTPTQHPKPAPPEPFESN